MGLFDKKIAIFSRLMLLCLLPVSANAESKWTIKPSREPMASEQGAPAVNGLPDGRIAAASTGDIRAAWYASPTTRYRHGILGDAIEAGELLVETRDGRRLSLVLPETEVFEDLTPRLVDLDEDGRTEIITIRADTKRGASVTLYGLSGNRIIELATTGFIGRANRWLNIAGVANFDGQPGMEIAFVRTPHIGGTLFFYDFRDGVLRQLGSLDGFSNHEIGSREMRLSAVADIDGDGRRDLALPSDDRRILRMVALREDGPEEIAAVRLPGRIDKAISVERSADNTTFTIGLDDGRVYQVSSQ